MTEEVEESVGDLEAAYANVFRGECKLKAGVFVCELTQPSFLQDGKTSQVEAHTIKAVGSKMSATPDEVIFDFTSPASCELYDFFEEKALICSADFGSVLEVKRL